MVFSVHARRTANEGDDREGIAGQRVWLAVGQRPGHGAGDRRWCRDAGRDRRRASRWGSASASGSGSASGSASESASGSGSAWVSGWGSGSGSASGSESASAVGPDVGASVGAAVGVAVGAAVGAAVGTAVGGGAMEATGTPVGAWVTGSWTVAMAFPPAMALTPSRFCQTVAPSTIPPLTTYVAAGSMSEGSNPIENASVGRIRDRQDLPSDERPRLDLDQCGDGDGGWTEGRRRPAAGSSRRWSRPDSGGRSGRG